MTEHTMITRRTWLTSMLGTIASGIVLNAIRPAIANAERAPIAVTVYKDPSCGCCTKWIAHLRANGFAPIAHDRSDMDALKDSFGVPAALRSCHTAVMGKFVIEGHVPAADMKRLFTTAPSGVLGLAVPGMPSGSPGMETPGRSDRYEVLSFSPAGATRVFATHG